MTASSLLAVWTWGSAGMLLWGLAAAIPLVLHLWSRRRFEEMPWAAMDFLLAAVRKNARRLRIEQLLLLLLRTCILVVFAMALADPLLTSQSGESASSAPSPTHYLFVLDTSYSMAYRSRDQTRLEAAKQRIQSVLEASRPGDGFSLLLLQDPPQTRMAVATTDKTELTRQLASVEISHGGADLYACLTAVDGQVDSNRRRNPQLERIHVVFLTDLGRTTWEAVARSDCQSLLKQLEEKAQLSLVDMAEDAAPNLAVTRVGADRSFVTLGETVRLEAEVRSMDHQYVVNARIEFFVSGRSIDSQELTIPANGRAIAGQDYRPDTGGDIPIEVRLSSDSLAIDNRRWMVLPVHKTLNVLCIQGEPEAADYVALALNPNDSLEAPIRATVASESALLEQTLQRYDCVLLSNVAQLGFAERNVLHQYVQDGGGLVIALGDRVQADSYNRELGDEAGPQRLLPARLEQLLSIEEHFFDPLEYKHPIVAPFRGHERSGLLTVPTWRYFLLKPYARPAEVALTFDNQHPAIVAETFGRGRSILIATALSPSSTEQTAEGRVPWTALPTWPSFPPLMDGLIRSATAGRDSPRNTFVGSPLQITSTETTSSSAQITTPDGSIRQIGLSAHDGLSRGTFSDTLAAGIYSAEIASAGGPSFSSHQRFAVNLDPRESDLSRIPAAMLPLSLQADVELESGDPVVPSFHGVTLFRYLLGAVAVLLVLESALASWFGRRAA